MKALSTGAALMLLTVNALAQSDTADITERNKALARAFYADLWFSNNTAN